MGRVTVPPAVPDPEPIDNVMLCANAMAWKISRARLIRSLDTEIANRRGRMGAIATDTLRLTMEFPIDYF